MSKLFIANCTAQNRRVYYRLDFNDAGERNPNARFQPARQQDIPPGRQVQIGGDFHITQIEEIVQQLVRYGLQGAVDVPRIRVNSFDPMGNKPTPMVFNVDKPVPADVIRAVRDINAGILVGHGKHRRQAAAVAVNSLVQQRVSNEFLATGVTDEPSNRIDVSFEQLEQSEAGEKRIEEGYKVDPRATVAPGPRGKNKGKGRRG